MLTTMLRYCATLQRAWIEATRRFASGSVVYIMMCTNVIGICHPSLKMVANAPIRKRQYVV